MNKIKPILLLILVFFIIPKTMWAQMKDYKYKRKLLDITKQWHHIQLPNDVYSKTLPNLNDIRIYGITIERDTIEAPYILNINAPENIYEEYTFKSINNTSQGEKYYYTFKMDEDKPINTIELYFKNKNFDWKVKLQGSNNQKDWYSIIDNYRIISIKNEDIEYQYTTLHFEPSQFQYYKLEIPSIKTPSILNAKLIRLRKNKGVSDTVKINNSELHISEKKNITEIKVQLPSFVRLSRVQLNISSNFDYYRDIKIKYIKDSVKTETGWIYQTELLGNATLNSLNNNPFSLKSTSLNNLIISINNSHNQPLDIENINLICYQHELTARFTQEAQYFLCYGNNNVYKPHYDIEKFTDRNYSVIGKDIAIARKAHNGF